MKVKHALIILVVGFAVSTFGALLKIMHWPGANVLLTVATVLQAVGWLTLLVKLVTYPKIKDFLDW